MALLTRKRLILAKIESTYGTDSTPGGTEAVLVRNLEITPLQADVVTRDLIRPYLGNFEQILANQRVEITFEVELAGSGAAGTAPAWSPVMKSCAMSETISAGTSVTYAPVSSSFSSCSIYFNNDGVRHKITGCRGSFSISGEVGQIPVISFTMMGIYNAPDDSALPTPTYSNQATPVIFKQGNTTGFQVFSYSGCLQSFSLDMANEMVYRELVGCTKEVLITNRAPNGTAVIEATTIATKDFFTIANGTSTGNLTFQHGQTAGNIVTFSSPQTDIGSPTYSDQDGIQMLNLPYVATPTTAGNDELSLVLT
jgi:hypothetical protein